MKKIYLLLLAVCSLLAISCDKDDDSVEKKKDEKSYFFIGKTYSYTYNERITDERDADFTQECKITYSLKFVSLEQIIKRITHDYPSRTEEMCDTITKTEEMSEEYSEVVEKKQASIKFEAKSLYFNVQYWHGGFNAKFEDEHTLFVSDYNFGSISGPFGNLITLTDTIPQ